MSIQPRPLVSIGMPVYNGERFLARALESLLAQDHRNFEIHVSDNASSDRTPDICREFSCRDSRVHSHRQRENVGAEANFDHVLGLAKGTYFMWASHDDLWEPAFISVQVAFLERRPDCVLVFPECDEIDEEGKFIRRFATLGDIAWFRRAAVRLKRYLLLEGKTGKATVIYGLMRTEAVRRTGGIRECCGAGISWDNLFVFGMLTLGPFGTVSRLLFHKRKRSVKVHGIPRLVKNRLASRDLHRYFNGYRTIVRKAATLTEREKAGLILLADLVEFKDQIKVWRI